MKKRWTFILPGLVLLALAALVLFRLTRPDSAAQVRRSNVPLVKVASPISATVTYSLEFTGDVRPIQQANLFAKVSGTLEQVFVQMGDFVRQDQMLALIDTTELYLQYQQASATFQNLRLSVERARDLFERNLTSKEAKDDAETAFSVAKVNYDLTATRLSYARIRAPFSGVITRRFLDPGALVSPSSTTLFTLMDLSSVKIIVPVLEKDISRVVRGQAAIVTVDAFPGAQFTGRIARFSEALDPDTRTMAVEVDVANPDGRLRPGMFANVMLTVGQHENALTIPTSALLKDDQGPYIFVARADTARKVRITPGVELTSSIEILSGIPDTTVKVITLGQQLVKDGTAVLIQP